MFTGIRFDKFVIFNFENGLSIRSIFSREEPAPSRRRRRSRADGDIDELSRVIFGILLLYAISLWLSFQYDRPQFWRLLAWGTGVLVVMLAATIGYFKLRASYRQRRLNGVIARLRAAAREQDFKNFLASYGQERVTDKKPWRYQAYRINWHRIHNFKAHLANKGLKLELSQLSIALQYYIREKEIALMDESLTDASRVTVGE